MSAPARRAMAEFAASHHGVVSRSKAATFGFTARDIRKAKDEGWVSEPVRGVLVVNGHARTWEQELAVATSVAVGPRVSNGAAARLFDLDGFELAPPQVCVLRPALPKLDGIIVRQTSVLEPADCFERHGLPCTSLARTLVDLGSTEDASAVWRALISARRIHRVSPTWLSQTAHRLHRPGQAGTGVMLKLLRRWSDEGRLPESWFEELIHRVIDRPDIPPASRQYELYSAGCLVARFDLAIPEARLALEAHSRAFHFGPINQQRDEDRDLRVAACGWEILYLGWYAQRRPAEVAAMIADVCRARLDGGSAV
jgi:hypothetical protein